MTAAGSHALRARVCSRAIAVWIALLVAVFAAPSSAASGDAFADGVAAYRQGDYAGARAGFLAALDDGSADRAATLHNLGNVAFRQQKPLEAAAWFTAALRVAPRSADTWSNLEFVRREAGLDPADRGDLRDTAQRLANVLTLAEAERLVLALLAALAIALAWEALRGGTAAKAAAWSLAALLAIAFVPYVTQLARADADPLFVVQPEGAALVSEPREGAALIGRVAPAALIERVDELPGWMRVRDGAETGWVRAESVVELAAGA